MILIEKDQLVTSIKLEKIFFLERQLDIFTSGLVFLSNHIEPKSPASSTDNDMNRKQVVTQCLSKIHGKGTLAPSRGLQTNVFQSTIPAEMLPTTSETKQSDEFKVKKHQIHQAYKKQLTSYYPIKISLQIQLKKLMTRQLQNSYLKKVQK